MPTDKVKTKSKDKSKTDQEFDKDLRRSKVDRTTTTTPKIPNTMYNTPPPNTPPPPYSPTGANTQWTTLQGPMGKQVVPAPTATITWTRSFECQTDTSRISMNHDGSWLYYSKGEGRAPAKPTGGDSPRKYFTKDGSKVVLSRDGWVEYDNGTGIPRASRVQWFTDTGERGWYAHVAVSTPTSVPTQSPANGKAATYHRKHDSVLGNITDPSRTRRTSGPSEDDEDPYDPNRKYGLSSVE